MPRLILSHPTTVYSNTPVPHPTYICASSHFYSCVWMPFLRLNKSAAFPEPKLPKMCSDENFNKIKIYSRGVVWCSRLDRRCKNRQWSHHNRLKKKVCLSHGWWWSWSERDRPSTPVPKPEWGVQHSSAAPELHTGRSRGRMLAATRMGRAKKKAEKARMNI